MRPSLGTALTGMLWRPGRPVLHGARDVYRRRQAAAAQGPHLELVRGRNQDI